MVINLYEQIISLYNEEDKQRRGYAFEQLVREIQPWSYKPPVSAIGIGEQLDGVYEWDGKIFIVEAKAKEGKIMQGSSDWEDFELKIRRRNKSVIGLFLSLYDLDENIVRQCEIMNREGYSIFVIYGDIWEKLYDNPISFELILKYLLINSRINNKATITSVEVVKKWFYHNDDIIRRYGDICVKSSSTFLRRYKQDMHEVLYVKRTLDKKIEDYIKNLYPKALTRVKKIRKLKRCSEHTLYEAEREIPPQILIIRDVCGAGKTTYAVENALSNGKYISFSKAAAENNVDSVLEETLQEFGRDYGIVGLQEINRPVVCVIDSLDEAQGIVNKIKEIKSLISLLPRLNAMSRSYGLLAYPILIVFTIREEYWREWEALFEGMHVKQFFKIFSEYNDEEFSSALERYQNAYVYTICNKLEKEDILTLSNPLNLYIFSETYKYSGNIEVRGIFTANVLHNYFKNKSEEIYKRAGCNIITPRLFLDVCENFLSMCVYKSLHLSKMDFYECVKEYFPSLGGYEDELLRMYESVFIFRFDEDGLLIIRHMKFLEYLYADYMIRGCADLKRKDAELFLSKFIDKINDAKIVDLIEIYNNVKYIYSVKKEYGFVQVYLEDSNEFVYRRLRDLRCRIAQGQENRISDYDQIVEGKNITDGNLLLEAFFVCSAKCNAPDDEELLTLFLKAWKANKNNPDRWKLLPKLNVYDLLDEERVMAQIVKSTSWKEWQVYLGYLDQRYCMNKFIEFIQESEECEVTLLLKRGGEWLYVSQLLGKSNNYEKNIFERFE